jgi:hypothetical protein
MNINGIPKLITSLLKKEGGAKRGAGAPTDISQVCEVTDILL